MGSLLVAGAGGAAIQSTRRCYTARPRAQRAPQVLSSRGADFRRAGFGTRRAKASKPVEDAKNLKPSGVTKLQRSRGWDEAYRLRTRLSRLRKSDDALVRGHLQAEIGREALAAGDREGARRSFTAALELDRRVFPAHLGLADLLLDEHPQRARAILEGAMAVAPERAYLAFERLARAYARCGAGRSRRLRGSSERSPRLRAAGPPPPARAGPPRRAFNAAARGEAISSVGRAPGSVARSRRAGGLPRNAGSYLDTAERSVFYLIRTSARPAATVRTTAGR